MHSLKRAEQEAVNRICEIYGGLSLEAKAEAARAISWAEKHLYWLVALGFGLGCVCGAVL